MCDPIVLTLKKSGCLADKSWFVQGQMLITSECSELSNLFSSSPNFPLHSSQADHGFQSCRLTGAFSDLSSTTIICLVELLTSCSLEAFS